MATQPDTPSGSNRFFRLIDDSGQSDADAEATLSDTESCEVPQRRRRLRLRWNPDPEIRRDRDTWAAEHLIRQLAVRIGALQSDDPLPRALHQQRWSPLNVPLMWGPAGDDPTTPVLEWLVESTSSITEPTSFLRRRFSSWGRGPRRMVVPPPSDAWFGGFPVPRISPCGCVDTGSQGQPVGTTSQLEPSSFSSAKLVQLTDGLRCWRQCMCSLPSTGEDRWQSPYAHVHHRFHSGEQGKLEGHHHRRSFLLRLGQCWTSTISVMCCCRESQC